MKHCSQVSVIITQPSFPQMYGSLSPKSEFMEVKLAGIWTERMETEKER